jgi:hypothetical protein
MTRIGVSRLAWILFFLSMGNWEGYAQAPVIKALEGNSRLTWTNSPGTNAFRIQWACTLVQTNGWKNHWWDLDYITSTGSSSTVEVPRYYRVVQETNQFDRTTLFNAWFLLSVDLPRTSIPATNSIYMIFDGNGNLVEHSGFNNEGPETGFYDVNPDGSFSIGLHMGGNPNPIVTVGQLLSGHEGVIQPPFAGARIIRVPDTGICQGIWTGTLTETVSPFQTYDISFTVNADGSVTNLTSFAGPTTGHLFALSNTNEFAIGCFRTGETNSNPYNQISIRGIMATNRITGVYETDTDLDESGTVNLIRP